jgi:hypothetical protein
VLVGEKICGLKVQCVLPIGISGCHSRVFAEFRVLW